MNTTLVEMALEPEKAEEVAVRVRLGSPYDLDGLVAVQGSLVALWGSPIPLCSVYSGVCLVAWLVASAQPLAGYPK